MSKLARKVVVGILFFQAVAQVLLEIISEIGKWVVEQGLAAATLAFLLGLAIGVTL